MAAVKRCPVAGQTLPPYSCFLMCSLMCASVDGRISWRTWLLALPLWLVIHMGFGQRWSGNPGECLCFHLLLKNLPLYPWVRIGVVYWVTVDHLLGEGRECHPEQSEGHRARGCVHVLVCRTWTTGGWWSISLGFWTRDWHKHILYFTEMTLMVGSGEQTRQ